MSGGLEYLVVFAILAATIAFLTEPVRKAMAGRPPSPSAAGDLDELEAARDAKYRELRDADLDHRTGKLSDADYEDLDRTLRGEAIEILRRIDRATIDDR